MVARSHATLVPASGNRPAMLRFSRTNECKPIVTMVGSSVCNSPAPTHSTLPIARSDLSWEVPGVDAWLATLASTCEPADPVRDAAELEAKTLNAILGCNGHGIAGAIPGDNTATADTAVFDAIFGPMAGAGSPSSEVAGVIEALAPHATQATQAHAPLTYVNLAGDGDCAAVGPEAACATATASSLERVSCFGEQAIAEQAATLHDVDLATDLDDLDDLVSALSSVSGSASDSASADDDTSDSSNEGADDDDDACAGDHDNDEDDEYWVDVDDLIACHKYGRCQHAHELMSVKYNAKWDGRVVLSPVSPSQPGRVGRARSCCVASLLASIRRRGDPSFVDEMWWIRLAEEREAARDKSNARACRDMAKKPVTTEWMCLVQVCGVGFGADYAVQLWFAAEVWQAAMDRIGPEAAQEQGDDDNDNDDAAMEMLERVRHDVAFVVLLRHLQRPVDRAAVDWAFGVRADGTRHCPESAVVLDTGDDLATRYADIVASGEHLRQHHHHRQSEMMRKLTAGGEGLDEEDEMAAAGLFGDLSSLQSDSSSDDGDHGDSAADST